MERFRIPGRGRPRRIRPRALAALTAVGSAALVCGCSATINFGSEGSTVKQTKASASAREFISKQLTDLPSASAIDCPTDVAAKAGTTFECHAVLMNGQQVTMPMRVASVSDEGTRIRTNPDVLDQALAVDVVYRSAQAPVKSVACPAGVKATVGKTFDCKLTFKGGKTDTVTVKLVQANAGGGQTLRVVRVHGT